MSDHMDLAPLEDAFADGLPEIDYHNIKKASMILRAINHRLRQQLLKTIYENNGLTVTQLFVKLRLEQSVASQHLAILRKSGIVTTERKGKFIYYFINTSRLQDINTFAKDILA